MIWTFFWLLAAGFMAGLSFGVAVGRAWANWSFKRLLERTFPELPKK